MLSRVLSFCSNQSNFENKINIILLLVQAGASPFEDRWTLAEQLKVHAIVWPKLDDPRIHHAIAQYLERKFKLLHDQEEFKGETSRCLTAQLSLGGIFNPADIVNEYLFDIEGDPKSVRWHDEDEKKE